MGLDLSSLIGFTRPLIVVLTSNAVWVLSLPRLKTRPKLFNTTFDVNIHITGATTWKICTPI